MACFVVASLPPATQGAQVIVTIMGTVQSGNDASAVFGTLGDLADQPFVLTFTYDDTKGTSSGVQTCPGTGEGYFSSIVNTNTSSPGTAVLQIGKNGGKFGFGGGTMGEISATSYALRSARTPCSSNSDAGFGVQASYGGLFGGTSHVGPSYGNDIFPAPGKLLSMSGDWSSPIFAAPLDKTFPVFFYINVTLGGDAYKGASGYLSPETLTVSGPTVNIFIGGAGDHSYGHAVYNYYEDFKITYPSSTYLTHAATCDDISTAVPSLDIHINLIGHSWGGDTAAKRAIDCGRTIALLITIDPVSWNTPSYADISSHATKWIDVNATGNSPTTCAQSSGGNFLAGIGSDWGSGPQNYSTYFEAPFKHADFCDMMRYAPPGSESPEQVLIDYNK